ncbi:sigma-54-dependent Fis family transcriptional regulator [Sporomusa acidovorans]|uniref:Anaerobic nitric oxide reductase transcription regulator NorR n=1 Tax=Sporomusa acidovorans (strain ATCC 49682 / DSM 3132 / Mol) TaxID=1123286 RepID=A0ABZ3IZC7_SPOA4|nr:sigma-54-dependent Fis family transcriptional regulator [Sporomusa acidovorans]OZC16832.1 transcriptional regulatory protein ZraR [Sporomusa acidovorans DSM 3132]SDF23776.1 PAS domain S-box-containing protein [Sporomusa acidovorans]
MLVRDFMTPNPHVLDKKVQLKEVVNLFYKYKLEAAPVVNEDRRLCGLVTRTDIIDTMMNHLPTSISVESFMTKSVVTIHSDNTLEEAWQIPITHLPVVDYEDKIIGLLNRQDFVKIFYDSLSQYKCTVEQLSELSYSGVICINLYGIITQINDVAARLVGVTKDAALGRVVSDIIPNTRLMKVITTGKKDLNATIEINGQQLTVNRTPICEGYKIVGALAIIQDIPANDNYEKEKVTMMAAKLEILEQVFSSLRQGLIVVDTNNVIRLVNSAYEEIMGIPRKDLLNHKAQDAVENSRMHIVLKTGVPEIDDMQSVNGRHIIAQRLPFFKNGKVVGAIGEAVFKDISQVEQLLERNKNIIEQNPAKKRIKSDNLQPHLMTFENIIGQSSKMIRVKNLAAKIAATDTTVLIQGESGTGKDLFAQAIHNASNRSNKPLVAINCAAIPAELLEAELFGYDEGAFTGARKGGKKGKFEVAEGGTLFLDEIGDMPLVMQAKLLRVMQNKTFEHVGGENVRVCNVRFIAATNKNLQELVAKGSFREDLYYRLNVVCLEVPPLRERKEDIREIIEMMMPVICNNLNISIKQFSGEAIEKMIAYQWPGNIRELINALEQLAATVEGMTIVPKQLPGSVLQLEGQGGRLENETMDESSKIWAALKAAHGNKAAAAKILGIHRSTLYEKLKKYSIQS